MKYAISILLAAGLLVGCGNKSDRIAFDGKYFRVKVSKVDRQLDVFQVTVKDAAQSIDGARAAARYEATKYCVGTYGSSDIVWSVGPDTPPEQLRLVDGALTFHGTCPQ
tara:strand:+ start:93392 stop:93718 length:327 start_codon:yes stop_codon:yes gene_type:complete